MRKEGLAPDTNVFNCMMDVAAKAAAHGKAAPEDGMGVLTWMTTFNAVPDRHATSGERKGGSH